MWVYILSALIFITKLTAGVSENGICVSDLPQMILFQVAAPFLPLFKSSKHVAHQMVSAPFPRPPGKFLKNTYWVLGVGRESLDLGKNQRRKNTIQIKKV